MLFFCEMLFGATNVSTELCCGRVFVPRRTLYCRTQWVQQESAIRVLHCPRRHPTIWRNGVPRTKAPSFFVGWSTCGTWTSSLPCGRCSTSSSLRRKCKYTVRGSTEHTAWVKWIVGALKGLHELVSQCITLRFGTAVAKEGAFCAAKFQTMNVPV